MKITYLPGCPGLVDMRVEARRLREVSTMCGGDKVDFALFRAGMRGYRNGRVSVPAIAAPRARGLAYIGLTPADLEIV